MSKTIEEQMLLLKESFDAVGTKLNGLTWQRIEKSHLDFAQFKTQELQDWKESMMQVHNELDLQGIGVALGLPLGSSIAPQVLPKVKELQDQNRELVDMLKQSAERLYTVQSPSTSCRYLADEITEILTKYK